MIPSDSSIRSILILTTDAGSGHRSAAIALEAALIERYGNALRVAISNPWQHTTAPALMRRYEQIYRDQLQRVPWLYQLSYTLSELPIVDRALAWANSRLSKAAIRHVLAEHPADLVISVYPRFSATVAAIYGTAPARPKLMTVVTDLGAVHRAWFSRDDDCCAVSTTIARQHALECGLNHQRVALTGLPVAANFGAPTAERAVLRRALGWRPDLPALLLLGGGAGVGELAALAHALDRAGLPLQLAVVAGANAALAERLRAYAWRIPVRVYDFVPLADMMHAADIVVTKAGGLTISEALAAGKPLLIHSSPPGQEAGNLRYVEGIGAGCWTPTVAAAVAQIRHWLADPESLRRVAAAACRHGRPEAAYRVAALAWDLIAGTPAALRDGRPWPAQSNPAPGATGSVFSS